MNNELKKNGFSLTEVLLAVGTFAIGMIFVAGVFPVAIYFTTVATERTIAAVVTDEAFAKIKLYSGVDTTWLSALPPTGCVDFNDIVVLDRDEFAYPSTSTLTEKHYYWSALCRLDPNDPTGRSVQVTVFVSRKIGASARYRDRDIATGLLIESFYPVPVKVGVEYVDTVLPIRKNRLRIVLRLPDALGDKTLINDGSTIVDDYSGQIYRVLERDVSVDNEIILDRNWDDLLTPFKVWVVPPPISGGRYPCIAIYQRVIRF